MNKTTRKQALLLSTINLLAIGPQAIAQDSGQTVQHKDRVLETIVVTAQSREKGLQDTPVSIAAITAEKIARAAIQKPEDLQFFVPNFTLTETGIGTNIFLRGIGSGVNQSFEQSVGTFIDGVNYPRAQQIRAPFLDVERIEVLRGPQSILFGKNSVAGALNITSATPTDELTGFLSGSYEFVDEEYIIVGAVSGPLNDRVRMRLAGRYRDGNGHEQNLTLDRSEPQREDWKIRWTGDFDLTDNLLARFKVEASEFDVIGRNIEIFGEQPAAAGSLAGLTYAEILVGVFGADASVLNTIQDGNRSSNGDFSLSETQIYSLDLNWSVGGYEVRSLSAYQNLGYNDLCDCDFTGAVVFNAGLQEDYSQFSQEIRVTSPVFDKYDFIAGLYFQTSDLDYSDQINIPGNSILIPAINMRSPGAGNLVAATTASRLATTDGDVYSAFAQVNIRPFEKIELQLGGRLSHEEKNGTRTLSIVGIDGNPLPAAQVAAPIVLANLFEITSTNLANLGPTGAFFIDKLGALPVTGSRKETRFSPEVRLVYEASENALLYASWVRGFKSGGFDFRSNNKSVFPTLTDSFEFEDEHVTNFEVGGKFSFLKGAAEVNFAAFFTKFDNLQVAIFDGVLGFNVGNAASSEIKGFEIDGRWAATDFLILSGSLAYTDFEFTDFQNGQCFFGQTPDVDIDGDAIPDLCDFTGNRNQLVSDVQATFTSDIHFPIFGDYEISNVTDIFYTSEYDTSNTFDPTLIQDGYVMINTRVSFGPHDGSWDIAVLGKNLTDKSVLQFGNDTPLAGSTFGVESNYGIINQGRTLWLQGRVNF